MKLDDPPSERQLKLLKKIGCKEVPKTRREAGKLLEKHLSKPYDTLRNSH